MECGAWSVGVWRVESVKCEVWSRECEVRCGKCGV